MGASYLAFSVGMVAVLLAGGVFAYWLQACRRGRMCGLLGVRLIAGGTGLLLVALMLVLLGDLPGVPPCTVTTNGCGRLRWPELAFGVPGLGLLALGIGRLISGIRAAQQAQAQDRLALEVSGVAVLVADPRGAVLSLNPVAEMLTGWSAAEACGVPVEQVFAWSASGEPVAHPVRQALAGEPSARLDRSGTLRGRTGARYRVEDATGLLRKADGATAGIVLVFRDVTRDCQACDALQAQEAQCRRLEESTARMWQEIDEERAQKMDALGRLAGGVAHDLNNQLGGIIGTVELMDLEVIDPELRRYLRQMQQAAGRASEMTQQLQTFACRGVVRPENVDLHALIAEVATVVEQTVRSRIVMTRRLLARPQYVSGDRGQLRKMLMTLVVYACDAMPEGGELTLTTAVEELPFGQSGLKPGRYFCLNLSDTGKGLGMEARSHLFEPFFTTRDGKGGGMGMAAVYGTVKSHQGEIRVESAAGGGTTFHLFLPVIEVATEPGATCVQDQAVCGHGRILLVDDEGIIRNVGEQLLQSLGYEVVVAEDGEEAVAYYRQHWREVDLVLLDMIMPRLGGRETFRAMRAINPDARVILVSGYSLDNEAQSVLEGGALGFIQKPLRRVELSQRLARALSQEERRLS
jgi:PAS domain S-box-containing protein